MTEAFSKYYWRAALSSDFLYPSNIEEDDKTIEDKGSLAESLKGKDLLPFLSTEKSSSVFDAKVLLRAFARQVTFIAVGIVAAPLGALYHGFHAMNSYINHDKEKAKKHIEALLPDLILAGLSIQLICSLFSIYVFRQKKGGSKVFYSRVFHVFYLGATFIGGGFLSWDPKRSASLFHYRDRDAREGYIKSLVLKRHFGIISEKGRLLSYSDAGNHEWKVSSCKFLPEGIFYNIHRNFNDRISRKFIELILGFRELKIPFPPTVENIEPIIEQLKKEYPGEEKFLKEFLKSFQTLFKAQEKVMEHEKSSVLRYCPHEELKPVDRSEVASKIKTFMIEEKDFNKMLKRAHKEAQDNCKTNKVLDKLKLTSFKVAKSLILKIREVNKKPRALLDRPEVKKYWLKFYRNTP